MFIQKKRNRLYAQETTMGKIYNKAQEERNKDREKSYQEVRQKLDELKRKKKEMKYLLKNYNT